jgi:maltooligosyltrehalose trehalohydrolase
MNSKLGAVPSSETSCFFSVWAPAAGSVDVHIVSPGERIVPMGKQGRGYFSADIEDVFPGTSYFYRLDEERDRPDPASRFQPEGVHGPSRVIRSRFEWKDSDWAGQPLEEYVIYEIHVGTFTRAGTFDAVIPSLEELKRLGITAVELMPVGQFPGDRNWGYDGAYPFAVQNSYGGPDGLKRFVDACHRCELAVILDVVYNHLGPEGNYFRDFAPYFTDRYRTPWGAAMNFDGPESDEVRRFFIENALCWISDYHVDALRLDATHAIYDFSAHTFLEELAESVHAADTPSGRRAYLIAESDRNDVRLISSTKHGGYGMDAQWSDDLHHTLHGLLTGERDGYYIDFGRLRQLAKAYREGFVYSGEYSLFRKRRHGSSSADAPGSRLVVSMQNHDQVGNRLLGERLSALGSFEDLKLAAGAVLLSPFVPLLFMGEEYGETAPFQYFISHSDPGLIKAVRMGRRREFADFAWKGEVPDPQSGDTFSRCILNHALKSGGSHAILHRYYRELIRLRKKIQTMGLLRKETLEAVEYAEEQVLALRYPGGMDEAVALFNFNRESASIRLCLSPARWDKILDSSDPDWGGPGSITTAIAEFSGEATIRIAARAVVLFLKRD